MPTRTLRCPYLTGFSYECCPSNIEQKENLKFDETRWGLWRFVSVKNKSFLFTSTFKINKISTLKDTRCCNSQKFRLKKCLKPSFTHAFIAQFLLQHSSDMILPFPFDVNKRRKWISSNPFNLSKTLHSAKLNTPPNR